MDTGVLIVDDEAAIRRLVRGALERAEYKVAEAGTATQALSEARRAGCALVLLDLGLPDRDGMELIPLIKALDRAIIVLTAREATVEKVSALDLGADDYIVKPFDTDELLARIRTALRHRTAIGVDKAIVIGDIIVDVPAYQVTRGGKLVQLTRKEFALLAELVRALGKVVTHRCLLTAVWGAAHGDDVEYLRVAMRGLRQKLEVDPAKPRLLHNEPGVGYRLVASD